MIRVYHCHEFLIDVITHKQKFDKQLKLLYILLKIVCEVFLIDKRDGEETDENKKRKKAVQGLL